MTRAPITMFALAIAAPAAAEVRGHGSLELFAGAPKFSDDDKRVRRPQDDAAFPERTFAGVELAVGGELALAPRFGVGAEAAVMLGLASQAIVERAGFEWHVSDRAIVGAGLGLQQLVLGSNEEGVGTSLHWNPLCFVTARFPVGSADIVLRIEGVRVCSNHGGCDFGGDGQPSKAGHAFNLLLGSVGVRRAF